MMDLIWMAWTWETAGFFGLIGLALVILTLFAIYRPETPRRGLLRFATTRGDRFFVSLLGAAYIFILFIRFGGETLWYPLIAAILFGITMFRFA
jgi:predicted small integral membrane protein